MTNDIHMLAGARIAGPAVTMRLVRDEKASAVAAGLAAIKRGLHKMNLRGIDWAIVGGESGPGARPVDPTWVIDIRDQCFKADVAFFFKQWGGVQKKKTGRTLEGRTWDQMPKLAVIS